MSLLRLEIKALLAALGYFTRLPVFKYFQLDGALPARALRYFPWTGLLTGLAGAAVFYFSQRLLPLSVAVALGLIVCVLFTGALHEDGFMDVCDGFGGGWERERILSIMKDSRVGAFGVLGVVLLLGLKYFLFFEVASLDVPVNRFTGQHQFYRPLSYYNAFFIAPGHLIFIVNLLAGHGLSRLAALIVAFRLPYAREGKDSKTGDAPYGAGIGALLFGGVGAVLPLFLFQNVFVIFLLMPPVLLAIYLSRYFRIWIGGYTGDCLGATQQIAEVVYFMGFLIFWNTVL